MLNTFISLNAAIGESALRKCRVLIVDDDEISAALMTEMVVSIAQASYICKSELAFELCKHDSPDLVILDVNMPNINGLELCVKLKQDPATEDISVIFATASIEHEVQRKCWEVGGTDFVSKPVLAMTLVNRVKNVLLNILRMKFLSDISFRDPLTGLCNRHYLNSEVNNAFKNAARTKTPFGLVVLDIDFFKSYNDTYGHLAGDRCLASVAAAIEGATRRPNDMVVRFGGEEFIIALPNTGMQGVKAVTQKILEDVRALAIPSVTTANKIVTVSAGYTSTYPACDAILDDVIDRADIALFDAKESGRNTLRGILG